ncbi:MAG: hypothetical protein DHS20C20_18480 [Ardenticatenaceae bacterium]|nr:MAG: hypothetical protein DHS20C20_18480 [Ardenticatenaceae bacterium]
MIPNIIQVQYDKLQDIAQQFEKQATTISELNQAVRNQADNLQTQWVGQGSTAFFREMEAVVYPTGRRLEDALREAQRVTTDICAIMQQAEEEASAPFRGGAASGTISDGTTGSGSGTSSGGSESNSLWDKIRSIANDIVDAADSVDDFLPIPMALLIAKGLRMGSTYGGQVLVNGSKWVKGLAGLSENLTHIKASNLAAHIGKGAKKLPVISAIITTAQGALAVADTWTENWEEYGTFDTPRKITAMGVDATLALTPVAAEVAGGMAGVAGGAKLGAAIGTLITPGIGTAVGAVIGGALGGFAGDWIGGQAGDAVKDGIINSGLRDQAIDIIDNNIAQPIANGINSAIDAVRDFELPKFSLPELSFGF